MVMASLLSGCLDNGSTAEPPTGFTATAGDGRVLLTWTGSPEVDYWLFTATDPSLTAFNWTGLSNSHAYINATTPFYMCGLFNGSQYYFAVNGRKNGGPGGSSSPTINAAPNNASASWTGSSTSPTGSTPNLYGLGYTGLTTCSNNATSAAGSFAAVGAGGAIFTSPDGVTWSKPTSPISTDLYAVTGYAANQNNPGNPARRWVAVGAGGVSVYSLDGISWAVGRPENVATPNPALRSLIQVAGTYFAVGDAASGAGTILSSTDGITWTAHPSGTTANLNGVTHGNVYVAVGDSGTVLTSSDGNTWTAHTSTPAVTDNLREVAAYASIIVAVGDGGRVVTSLDNGTSWTAQSIGAMNLVGVAAESQYVYGATADPQLGYVSTAQFVAVDDAGKTYSSVNGITWSTAINTGITTNISNLGKPLVSSGFGYVAAGNTGATAYAF